MPAPVRSIGQVLTILKAEFPDVSISKIRFLEAEGLLSPERAPSGYRRYAQVDIDRLAYILRVQRDHYLPLRVIKEHLDQMDSGAQPPSLDAPPPTPAAPAATEPADLVVPAPRPTSTARGSRKPPVRMTRRELLAASGLSEGVLVELERLQVVYPRRGGGWYGREALTICVVARKLRAYGMDSRHLRAIKYSAEREAGLVEQAVAPLVRRKDGSANEAAAEVTQLVIYAHTAMMHGLIDR